MIRIFQEPTALNAVALFHETFGHPILDEPTIPEESRKVLRVNLLTEEVKELQHALKSEDIVEVADALADIQYVLSGAIHEMGLGHKFNEIFEEVQRSNMSKMCKTIEEAEATIEHYGGSEVAHMVPSDATQGYVVYRTSDMKILKSINYSPADIKSIIERDEANRT
jgi:predicted HAD superfamily Cof-like phosphohydrolase